MVIDRQRRDTKISDDGAIVSVMSIPWRRQWQTLTETELQSKWPVQRGDSAWLTEINVLVNDISGDILHKTEWDLERPVYWRRQWQTLTETELQSKWPVQRGDSAWLTEINVLVNDISGDILHKTEWDLERPDYWRETWESRNINVKLTKCNVDNIINNLPQ